MIKFFIIVFVLFVLGYAIWVYSKTKKNTPLKHTGGNIDWVPGADDYIDTDVIDSRSGMTNDIFISGLAHHCTINDCGIFGGIVFNDDQNPIDKKAMAIGSHQSGKTIGYVPAAILDSFRKWCGKKDCHCVGYIYREEGALRGRARVYHPDCDLNTIGEDGAKYLETVCERFGWEIPDGDFKI